MESFGIIGFVFAMIAFSQIFVLRKEINRIKERLSRLDKIDDKKLP